MSPDRQKPTPEGNFLRPNETMLTRHQIGRLAQLNPLTDLLNPVTYSINFGEHGEKFDPDSFDPIQVVWVQVTPNRKELLIKDGHHRTALIDQEYDSIITRFPGFQMVVRNVTESAFGEEKPDTTRLRGPVSPLTLPDDLVIEATEREAPFAIPIKKYMDITVPAMERHKEVLPLRVSALLMKRWGGLVGEAIEDKFSGLAALTLLDNQKIRFTSMDDLKAYLEGEQEFFEGNTSQQRQTIRGGIVGMAELISGYHLSRSQAANSAFVILSTKPDVIGGSTAFEKQIAGVLYLPAVQEKLRAKYGTGTDLSQGIRSLTRDIMRAFQAAKKSRDVSSEIRPIYTALADPQIGLADIDTVIKTSNKRQETLDNIYTKINQNGFTKVYLEETRKGKTSRFEDACISTIVGKQPVRDVRDTIDRIASADHLRTEALTLERRLANSTQLTDTYKTQLSDSLRHARVAVIATETGLRYARIIELRIRINEIKDLLENPPARLIFMPGTDDAMKEGGGKQSSPRIKKEIPVERFIANLTERVNQMRRDIEDLPPEIKTTQAFNRTLRNLREAIDSQLQKEE